jgi:hypothetical protein
MEYERQQPEAPSATLERVLLDEFLSARGHTWPSVRTLDPDQSAALLRGASEYASLRLAEIESRAEYVSALHAR